MRIAELLFYQLKVFFSDTRTLNLALFSVVDALLWKKPVCFFGLGIMKKEGQCKNIGNLSPVASVYDITPGVVIAP